MSDIWNYIGDFETEDWDEDDWEALFQEEDEFLDRWKEEIQGRGQKIEKYYSSSSQLYRMYAEFGFENIDDKGADDEHNYKADNQIDLRRQRSAKSFRFIPVWQKAHLFASAVHNFVTPIYDGKLQNEDVYRLQSSSLMVEANIAAGHEIGYSKDRLCGNIAKCKRALASLEKCLEAVIKIENSGIVPIVQTRVIFDQAIEVREALVKRIINLRKRKEKYIK